MSNPIDELIPPPDADVTEIAEALFVKVAETGDESELDDAAKQLPTLGARKRTPEEWAEHLARWHLRNSGDLAALEARYKPLIEDMESELRKLKSTKQFIEMLIRKLMPGGEGVAYVTEVVSLSYKPSQATECTDPKATPFEFLRIFDPEPDRKAIGDALKAGQSVPGWKLTPNWNLQVKRGGLTAIKSAAKKAKKLAAKKSEEKPIELEQPVDSDAEWSPEPTEVS